MPGHRVSRHQAQGGAAGPGRSGDARSGRRASRHPRCPSRHTARVVRRRQVKAKTLTVLALSAGLPLWIACGNSVTTAPAPAPGARPTPVASTSASGLPPELMGAEYTENDFVESDRNRDPFRSFIVQNQAVNRQAMNQRKVELAQYSIDELKLVAIVTGGEKASAMFVAPSGRATVVYKGPSLCRREVVRIGGSNGPEYQLNWRVDRIRGG